MRSIDHVGRTILLAWLLVMSQVVVVSAASTAQPSPAASVPMAAASLVSIDGGAAATNDDQVTVTVPAPSTSAGLLHVSNDGGTTWVEIPYAISFAWSLVDPAAGGVDADGAKTVTIEAGDGATPWVSLGEATILLDRTPPQTSGIFISDTSWVSVATFEASDSGAGLLRTEVSLDGVHWRPLDPSPFRFYGRDTVDLREGTIGGSWALGPRKIFGRAVDKVGNVSAAVESDFDLTAPTGPPDDPPATFEFPLPAVTGQLFTVKPVFQAGFHVRSGDHCEWRLKAGDAQVRLEAESDETLIDVEFPVSPVNGLCPPWTFTLPYSPPLEYSWSLAIMRGESETVYTTSDLAGSFRAELGSTSRAITYSNLPLTYLLPDRELVGTGGTVTYRLYTAGGMSTTTGTWSCWPPVIPESPLGFAPQSQVGGTSFDCRITSSGPWRATWVRLAGGRRWLVQFDPVSDRHRPVVSNIWVLPSGDGTMASLRWTATDQGTGVARYELAVSRNGGAYTAIPLPSHRTTSIEAPVVLGSRYRYRVRAVDRAGNVGAWAYSATITPARYDDSASNIHWSSTWTTSVVTGAVHGSLRSAEAAGAAASMRFTGRSVGWIAPRGPGMGFGQVWVDGVLAATINLAAAADQPSRVVWRRSWTSAGSHLIRIVVLGTDGRPTVAIDGFAVLR